MSAILLVCASLLVPSADVQKVGLRGTPFSVVQVAGKLNDDTHTRRGADLSVGSRRYGDPRGDTSSLASLEEFIIDTSKTYVGAYDEQKAPSIATDGTGYLVVWADHRDALEFDIYGTRLDESGRVLEPWGIPISTAPFDQNCPSVAFDGINYIVVWEDYRTGSDFDIYGARVDRSGHVLDSLGMAICTMPEPQNSPCVAFDGVDYFVVWHDRRAGPFCDIYGTRLDTAGTVLDTLGIAISTAIEEQRRPAVSFDGANYLVVWEDSRSGSRDIYGARVAGSGIVLDTSGIAICAASGDQFLPFVVFDGTNQLAVWEDRRAGFSDIYGARLDTSGAVLDTPGIAISTAGYSQASPSARFDGTHYVVTWEDHRSGTAWDIYGARVDTSGFVIDVSGIPISTKPGDQTSPFLAFNGSDYLVAWEDWLTLSDICGVRLDTSVAVLDTSEIPISTSASRQQAPAAAFGITDYLVVWEDNRWIHSWDIYGARVDRSGVLLDSSAIAISFEAQSQKAPAVGFEGTNYFVVWQDYRTSVDFDVYGARVDQAGHVLDPLGIPICTVGFYEEAPSLAFDGTNHLVAWQDWRSGTHSEIFGARVTKGGVVLDTLSIPIAVGAYLHRYPSVAFDGTNYLVVWQDYRNGSACDIYAARVDQSGIVLDPSGLPISAATGQQRHPCVAFDGTNYLIVWEDERNGFGEWDIYGARMAQTGAVLDSSGIAICTVLSWQEHPSVAFDGAEYFVVWEDYRCGFPECDIYGARVATSGVVVDTSGLEMINQFWPRTKPHVAKASDAELLITYEGFFPMPYNSQRILGAFRTGVGIQEGNIEEPERILRGKLFQNSPNPFSSRTMIRYEIPLTGHVSLKVYDSCGRLVRTLVDGKESSGGRTVSWDGRDGSGRRMGSGVYFYRLDAGGSTTSGNMILIR
ncbi:MAG: FlgD immunoglobulin-like domain containing protein [Thermoplasmata archaeon]